MDNQGDSSLDINISCIWCGGKLGEEYWDIDKFASMKDCLNCGRPSSI